MYKKQANIKKCKEEKTKTEKWISCHNPISANFVLTCGSNQYVFNNDAF